jgi:hypothetical protein
MRVCACGRRINNARYKAASAEASDHDLHQFVVTFISAPSGSETATSKSQLHHKANCRTDHTAYGVTELVQQRPA